MMIKRIQASYISVATVVLAGSALAGRAEAQALNMDGQSGIFFQPWADVVPSAAGKFGGPTISFHTVDAGPVAGDYLNVGVEEGFGNWLEFGFTRNNHTDGGDPAISPLFNFSGMNIFNVKAKVLPANYRGRKYLPAISLGGVLRTNDPFVSQSVAHKNATNGDIYLVGSKLGHRRRRGWVAGPLRGLAGFEGLCACRPLRCGWKSGGRLRRLGCRRDDRTNVRSYRCRSRN